MKQISKEQAEFMKDFIKKYNVDENKFTECISKWNETAKTEIKTKADLGHSDYDTLQSFIDWVKNIEAGKNKTEQFVTPSTEQIGVVW